MLPVAFGFTVRFAVLGWQRPMRDVQRGDESVTTIESRDAHEMSHDSMRPHAHRMPSSIACANIHTGVTMEHGTQFDHITEPVHCKKIRLVTGRVTA